MIFGLRSESKITIFRKHKILYPLLNGKIKPRTHTIDAYESHGKEIDTVEPDHNEKHGKLEF